MKQKKSLVIVFCMFLITFSCEYEIQEENENIHEMINLSSTPAFFDYDGGELPEVTVTAHWPLVEESNMYPDEQAPDDNDSRSWWNPPTEDFPSGGGSSSSASGNVKLSTNLIKRFPAGSNLSEADLKKLNKEYKILLLDCVYKSIDDYISSHWNKSGKIKMSGIQQGLASIDSNGNLNFYGSDQITATNLAHEWIHAFQMAFNPACSSLNNNYAGMMEFDLAVFQDLICYAKNGYTSLTRNEGYFPEGSCWINSLNLSNRTRHHFEISYLAWLESICVNKQFPIRFDQTMYLYWADIFGCYHRGYSGKGYNFQNKEYGTKSLESLIEVATSNCFK